MKTYGYVRVSTKEQNEQRQIIAMEALNIPKHRIYLDKQSGKDFDRPAYRRLLRAIRKGDVLIIKSIDRLGRDYREIQEQWHTLTYSRGIHICVIDMPILDTRKDENLIGAFIGDMALQVMSFVAENERDAIRQRQAEGIAAAKLRGVTLGRPEKPEMEALRPLAEAWERGEMSISEVLRRCNLSAATFYRRLHKLREERMASKDA